MKNITLQDDSNKFFKMLYLIFTVSSLGFAARIFMSTIFRGKDVIMGVITCTIFTALAVFYIYAAFIRKDGKEFISKLPRLQYASLGLLLIQIILTVTDIS